METGRLHEFYPFLYGNGYDENEMDERYLCLEKKHKDLFNNNAPMIFSAAGRTEIGGNHTDHNQGKVIGGTINLDTIAAVSERDDMRIILASEGFPTADIDISNLDIKEEEKNSTEALLRGIARAFRDRGFEIRGWQANTSTKVLKGSGLSSSAAIEVLCAEIFNNLYAGDTLSPIELAEIGQFAENTYFGKPSGLLDQLCCACGGITGIDFKDKSNPKVKKIPADFSDFGYVMIITDTKGNHANLTHEYAAVPSEMKQIAEFYGKNSLRDIDFRTFMNDIPEIRKSIKNDRALLRAYHFFTENIRVDMMLEALENNDFDDFLNLVKESGDSSFRFLQNAYQSSHAEEQGLSLGIALSESIMQNSGAVRVHGGGFAGTIQAYVPEEDADVYIEEMERVFGKGSAMRIEIRKNPVCRIL